MFDSFDPVSDDATSLLGLLEYNRFGEHIGHTLAILEDGSLTCIDCHEEIAIQDWLKNRLRPHMGHEIVAVIYGGEYPALECETCCETLLGV